MNQTFNRHRRLRANAAMRDLVKETRLHPSDFIYPLFVVEGLEGKKEVPSMPGVYHVSLDLLKDEMAELISLGIKSVIVFGVPEEKDACGTQAFHDHGIVQKGIAEIKKHYPEMIVIADTCLCEYTDHGHCGVVKDGEILNDESLELLAQTAVSQAKAGADIIAPSNMMDGFVTVIREALDKEGFTNIPIMSYAVKPHIVKKGEHHYVMDGKALIEEVNDLLDIAIENEDIDTIAGWLLTQKMELKNGDVFHAEGCEFKVLEAEDHHIRFVEIKKTDF
ncbi:transporter associated domain-containing protein [Bacillus velezensis]|uniref:transporter associated domain-containing protein n=1 Tax=Bacillus velezensis TaxID=492670 RepID=UPI003D67EC88